MSLTRRKLSLADEFTFHDIKLKELSSKWGPGFRSISFDNKMSIIGSQFGTFFFT